MGSYWRERLHYADRSLRILPGKLLLGPTGKRLYADYLDKEPGFSGRIDFIHKANLPRLFGVSVDGLIPDMRCASSDWYPDHLHFEFENDRFRFEEDKFITWDDVAVSRQTWLNKDSAPHRLALVFDGGFALSENENGFLLERHCQSHAIDFMALVRSSCDFSAVRGLVIFPGQRVSITVCCAAGEKTGDTQAQLRERIDAILRADDPLLLQTEQYYAWFDDLPRFTSDDELLDTTYIYHWYILRNSYTEPGLGHLRNGYFCEGRSHKLRKDPYAPSGHDFTQFIQLSLPFHLLDSRWRANDRCCREAIRSFVSSIEPDGTCRTETVDGHGFAYGNFSVWAIAQYFLLHPDRDFLREILPALKRSVLGVWKSGKGPGDDLMICRNHRLTGKEYQPSYWYFRGYPDNAKDESSYDWMKRVDLSVYLYRNVCGILQMCGMAGDQDTAEFADLAERIKAQIMEKMWDPDSGFFYDLHHATDEKAMVKCIDGFYPLWGDMTGAEHLPALEALLDKEQFATGSGFATVTKKCPVYKPYGSWKDISIKGRDGCVWDGPSWPYTTSIALDMIAEQSRKYAHRYDAEFGKFLRELSWQHYRNGSLSQPYLVEHYHAETGEPLSDEADYNHSMYIDLIIRHVVGLRVTDGGFAIDPVHVGLQRYSLENVRLLGHSLSIRYSASDGYRIRIDDEIITLPPSQRPFTYSFGDAVLLPRENA